MPQFTAETAVEMGKRSAALQKQRKEQRALILAVPPPSTELTTDHSTAKAERIYREQTPHRVLGRSGSKPADR